MDRRLKQIALAAPALAVAAVFGGVVRGPQAQVPDPALARLGAEVAALRAQVAQLEGRVAAAAAPAPALQALQAKLEPIAQAVQVGGGSVVIRAPGSVSIEGGAQVALRSAGAMRLDSGAALELRTGGPASITGSTVSLNGGKRPVAALGSRVAGDRVADGSPVVLVP